MNFKKHPRPLSKMIPLMSQDGFFLFSHRGYGKRGPIPENTWPAFEAATRKGFQFHELDVSLSKDHIPIVFHGPLLESTTNGKGRLKEWTLTELEKLDWGDYTKAKESLYGKKNKTTPILTLEEYLERTPEKIVTNIEIKKRKLFPLSSLERRVRDLVRQKKIEQRVLVSSFHVPSLIYFRFFAPELARGLLVENSRFTRLILPLAICLVRPDSLHLPNSFLTEERIARYQGRGYEIIPWVVNDEERLRWLKRNGVRAAITDNIELIKTSPG